MNRIKFKLILAIFSAVLISIRAESQQLFEQMGAELSIWSRNTPFSEGKDLKSSNVPVLVFTLEGVSRLSEDLNAIARVGYGSKQQNFQSSGTTFSPIEVTHKFVPVHLGIEYSLSLSASPEASEKKHIAALTIEAGMDRYFELNHIIQFDAAGTTIDRDFRNGGNYYGYSGGLALELRFPILSLALTTRYRGVLVEGKKKAEADILYRNSPSGIEFGLRLRVPLSKPLTKPVTP